ncbi:hypothetical protein FNV43_RR04869 [Rhamnella rubrinervis]|uniref:FAM86 N-terminal domain-containing protein n=1 Tax=Rhamnella rubrinervis TaxID=2594499 RepID=A0A8K0HKL2_9ROSA|nr:hypothetical protein FNV43_RR04869 [Rhamnella rubrinervis]
MADREVDRPTDPKFVNLVSAFLAMESTDSLIALARVSGEGSVTERVQRFIWTHCMNRAGGKFHAPYLKNFLKKLISQVEMNHGDVLDDLYERYAYYMSSLKDDDSVKGNSKIYKYISFLFPDGCFELSSCPESGKLLIPLQCSLNMLEGDTGCSIWPSSLYLSECILSFPELFSNKSCFEVGSGVGLVGICLAHVKASQVILSDGDMSTLANMKLNLELNHLGSEGDFAETDDANKVKCVYLPWESATERELENFKPDIILGADVIYDPECLPHLVQVLGTLLNQMKPYSQSDAEVSDGFDAFLGKTMSNGAAYGGMRKGPVALLASVIRNIDTFNKFLALVDQANLSITDVTETLKPINLLPYMRSYDRTTIRLFILTFK